jgi:hypothetical protein
MKHCIFVPWDASECAHKALQYAIGLTRVQGNCTTRVAPAHVAAKVVHFSQLPVTLIR